MNSISNSIDRTLEDIDDMARSCMEDEWVEYLNGLKTGVQDRLNAAEELRRQRDKG